MTLDCRLPIGASLGRLGRENADAMRCETFPGPDGPTVLLVVCDGVSASRRRAEASRLTCEVIAEEVRQQTCSAAPSDKQFPGMLETVIIAASRRVREALHGQGQCCVVAAIVEPEARRITTASVGDSMLYLYTERILKALNRPDHTVRVAKARGKTVQEASQPLVKILVSQVLGQEGDVHPHISSYSFEPDGRVLCLSTDGIPAGYLQAFLQNASRPLQVEALTELCSRAQLYTQDDASLVLLELGQSEETQDIELQCLRYDLLDSSGRNALLERAQATEGFSSANLSACLEAEVDFDRAERIVAVWESRPPSLRREQWVTILDCVAQRFPRLVPRLGRLVTRAGTR